jgi:hypothetical protein
MKFLNRKIRSEEAVPTEDAQRIVHREIEWISVTAGTTAEGIAQTSENGQRELGLLLPTGLPPPKRE